ncbi:MAG: hypothetical protein V4795_00505 [Pseudomonadota bacterium]
MVIELQAVELLPLVHLVVGAGVELLAWPARAGGYQVAELLRLVELVRSVAGAGLVVIELQAVELLPLAVRLVDGAGFELLPRPWPAWS